MNLDFSAILRGLRVKHNFSASQMAEKLGISESTYRKYETGKKSPTLDMLFKIASIFCINVKDLLGFLS